MTLQITSSSIEMNNGSNTFKFDADDRLLYQRAAYSGSGVTIAVVFGSSSYPASISTHIKDISISNLVIDETKDVVVGTIKLTSVPTDCNIGISMLSLDVPINQGIPIRISEGFNADLLNVYLAIGLMKTGLTANVSETFRNDWARMSTYYANGLSSGSTNYAGSTTPDMQNPPTVVFNYNLKVFRYAD